jgi:hypothetical protein
LFSSPQWAGASSSSRFYDHNQTHRTRDNASGKVISPSLKPPPDNTQQFQKTNIQPTMEFEPVIPVSKRLQNHAFDRVTTGMMMMMMMLIIIIII